MHDTIIHTIDKGIATITLNRPDSLNSFNQEMHTELRTALIACWDNPDIRCIILTGAGRGFCAGQDLNERSTKPAEGNAKIDLSETVERNYNPLIRMLTTMPKPIIAAVNGVAAGAGASIALACDIVIASKKASFVQAFSRVGLVPDSGGTWSLLQALGLPRAKALTMLGDKLPAEQAEQWGLIWKTVEATALAAEAETMARELITRAPMALAETKRLLHEACHSTLTSQIERERMAMRTLGASEDYREGVDAFLNKRAAVFTGK